MKNLLLAAFSILAILASCSKSGADNIPTETQDVVYYGGYYSIPIPTDQTYSVVAEESCKDWVEISAPENNAVKIHILGSHDAENERTIIIDLVDANGSVCKKYIYKQAKMPAEGGYTDVTIIVT